VSDEVSQLECFDKGLISTDAGFPFLVGKPTLPLKEVVHPWREKRGKSICRPRLNRADDFSVRTVGPPRSFSSPTPTTGTEADLKKKPLRSLFAQFPPPSGHLLPGAS
jgi:hypothetical protein